MRFTAAILIVIAGIIRYVIRKKAQARRTETGAEVFDSYSHAWKVRIYEILFSAIAIILVIVSVILFLLSLRHKA